MISFHMLPSSSMNNIPYGCLRYTTMSSKLSLAQRDSIIPDIMNIFFGQLRKSIFLPTKSRLWMSILSIFFSPRKSLWMCLCKVTAFSSTILHIIRRCAKKQVLRINTARIITVMADKQTFWNATIDIFPSQPMSIDIFACPKAKTNLPISRLGFCTNPNPASFGTSGFINSGLKSNLKWNWLHYCVLSFLVHTSTGLWVWQKQLKQKLCLGNRRCQYSKRRH